MAVMKVTRMSLNKSMTHINIYLDTLLFVVYAHMRMLLCFSVISFS